MTLEVLIQILAILFIHWVADFLFQDVNWANNKSKDNRALTSHVMTYSAVVAIGMSIIFYIGPYNLIGSIAVGTFFGIITYICHWFTDYITSRIVARKFAKKEYGTPIPNTGAFTVIGFDQWIHYLQLFLTYYLLT